MLSIWADYSQ